RGQSPSPRTAAGRALPEVSVAQGHRGRLLVVGMGGCEPRHDAAHLQARPTAEPVLRDGLWRKWCEVFGRRRPQEGGDGSRAGGWGKGRGARPADIQFSASWPRPAHAFQTARTVGHVPLVLPQRRNSLAPEPALGAGKPKETFS